MPPAVSATDIFRAQQLTNFPRAGGRETGGARTLSAVADDRQDERDTELLPARAQPPGGAARSRGGEAVARLEADSVRNSVRLQSDLASPRTQAIGGVEFRFRPEILQEVERTRALAQESRFPLEEVRERSNLANRAEALRAARQEETQRGERAPRRGDRLSDELSRGVMVSVLA